MSVRTWRPRASLVERIVKRLSLRRARSVRRVVREQRRRPHRRLTVVASVAVTTVVVADGVIVNEQRRVRRQRRVARVMEGAGEVRTAELAVVVTGSITGGAGGGGGAGGAARSSAAEAGEATVAAALFATASQKTRVPASPVVRRYVREVRSASRVEPPVALERQNRYVTYAEVDQVGPVHVSTSPTAGVPSIRAWPAGNGRGGRKPVADERRAEPGVDAGVVGPGAPDPPRRGAREDPVGGVGPVGHRDGGGDERAPGSPWHVSMSPLTRSPAQSMSAALKSPG